MEPTLSDLKQEARELISRYSGEETARLYLRFYEGKPMETILDSLEELLAEFAGAEVSQKHLEVLRKKYSLIGADHE